jgi:uncharacterized protein YycO
MKLAFYKGKGNLFDWLIRKWTQSRYSHCELVFRDGAFFSADPRSGGVRYLRIEQDPEKWDFVELILDEFDENKVRRWCNKQVGKRYDWLGILLCQIIPIGVDESDWYFCSEICTEALQKAGKLMGIISHWSNPKTLALLYELE